MAANKVGLPGGAAPGGDLKSDLETIRGESRRDMIAMAKHEREMALLQMWKDAEKGHSDMIKSGLRA